MRRRRWLIALVALILGIGIYSVLVRTTSQDETALQTKADVPTHSVMTTPSTNVSRGIGIPTPSQVVEQLKGAKARFDAKDEWRTPIQFYGKVLDENSRPVPDATISFGWTDLSIDGYSKTATRSDGTGLFSLTGVTGKHLTVIVSKEGYYTSKNSNDSFTYAGENVNFIPNSNSPEVFRLHKKGKSEALIRMGGLNIPGYGMSFRVPKTGSPLTIDLAKSSSFTNGKCELRIEFWVNHQVQASVPYDWRLRISVPDGGLLESTEEFDFVAPETEYRKSFDTNMVATLQQNWQNQLTKNFFIKFESGQYARVRVAFTALTGVAMVDSYLNPTGSRNLEYDPKPQLPQ